MKKFYSIYAIVLLISTLRSSGSTVELTNDDNDEMHMSVVSSKPETTYSGKLGFKTNQWGYRNSLRQEYKSGEEFCFYTPVLGMRNFTCHVLLTKYWDIDVVMIMRDSEGGEIAKGSVTVSGKRSPHIALHYESIPRPDILSVCVQNLGTTKTIYHSIFLTSDQHLEELMKKFKNVTDSFNLTALALGRVENRLNEIQELSKFDGSNILQDYFRLLAIKKWVDGRCIINSLLMLFCCGGSTALIRRWFGTPRSTV